MVLSQGTAMVSILESHRPVVHRMKALKPTLVANSCSSPLLERKDGGCRWSKGISVQNMGLILNY